MQSRDVSLTVGAHPVVRNGPRSRFHSGGAWLWRWVLVVLFLSSLGFVVPYLWHPEGLVFLGFIANNDDNQLYLSFMREGAQGAWLTTIRFTPENHQPILLLPLYLVLGKAARVLKLSNELVFHLARLLGGLALVSAAWRFSSLCLPDRSALRTAFLLTCFSSGFGWLMVITGLADKVMLPVDVRVPEASTFLTMLASPHLVAGVTFQLLTFIFLVRARERRWCLVGAAISFLLLAVTLVYNVIVVATTLLGYAVIHCWQRRRLGTPQLLGALAVGGTGAPVILYYYVVFRWDPFWSIAYGKHDIVPTPPFPALVLGYGLPFFLALWGLARWTMNRQWTSARILLGMWAISSGFLVYTPLAFQGKLLTGLHVGLCVLAAAGLHEGLLPWLRTRTWFESVAVRSRDLEGTVRNVVLILTVPSTLLVALIGVRVAAAEHYFPYFLSVDDVNAVTWLETYVGADDVVLSSYAIGNYLVAHTNARSFLGHQFAVIEPAAKAGAVHRFYSGEADDEWQYTLAAEAGITLVYYGSHEQSLGAFDPDRTTWLRSVYRSGQARVYEVQ
jgi:hypothetical protein